MATITVGGTTWNTTAGDKTVTFTPAVNDLIVIVYASSGLAGGATGASDNNADGNGSGWIAAGQTATGFSTTGLIGFEIRTNLIGSATSTTVTSSQSGSSGGGLCVLRVAGMTKTGSSAVRSSGQTSSGGSGATPAPNLSQAALSGNPVIGALGTGNNSTANATPRSSPAYTEATDLGYNTPATGIEVMYINSGETAQTITWGSTVTNAWGATVIELDATIVWDAVVMQPIMPAGAY